MVVDSICRERERRDGKRSEACALTSKKEERLKKKLEKLKREELAVMESL